MFMDIRYMILVYLIRCKIYSIIYTRIYEFLDVYELFVEQSSFNICCVFPLFSSPSTQHSCEYHQ